MTERLQRYCDYFARLTPAQLERLDSVFAADARFKDPFNDVRGIAAIRRVFAHMYETTVNPRFEVLDAAEQGDIAYIHWRFLFAPKRRPQGEWSIEGMSRIRFDAGGLAVEHIDYWDPIDQLLGKLPVIGALYRLPGRLLRASK